MIDYHDDYEDKFQTEEKRYAKRSNLGGCIVGFLLLIVLGLVLFYNRSCIDTWYSW